MQSYNPTAQSICAPPKKFTFFRKKIRNAYRQWSNEKNEATK